MKLNYIQANAKRDEYLHLVGSQVNTSEGVKEIKDIVVLPIENLDFSQFVIPYKLAQNKEDFLKPHMNKEMSLVLFFTDGTSYPFFQYIVDNQ